MVQLDYRDARPIYTQIVDNFRNQVKAGILQKGDKLPSVRELATALTINPNTIQRAYRELEMEGWIASVPGKGSFVCGVPGGTAPETFSAWERFDQAVTALRSMGVSTQELMTRLQQGGNENA